MPDNETYTAIADLQRLVRGNNSQSFAMLNTVMAETIGMSMHNAVSTQHNSQTLNSAATASTCARILSVISAKAIPVPATPVADNTSPPAGSTAALPASTATTVAPPANTSTADNTGAQAQQLPPAGNTTTGTGSSS